jgi:hypothetical protein
MSPSRRQQRLRPAPQRLSCGALGQVAVEAQRAGQHALDVAVEDGHPLAEAEGRNGGGGGRPMPGSVCQRRAAWRKAPPCSAPPPARSGAGCARGCSSPGRSTAPAPRPAGRGQRLHGREALQEARVVVQHGGHLGLLQHHLGQPHAVGVARALPGQVVAAVLALPGAAPLGGERRAAGALPGGPRIRPQDRPRPCTGRRGRQRRAGACQHVVGAQVQQALQFGQLLVLRLDLGDALFQFARGRLDALQRLAALLEGAAAVAAAAGRPGWTPCGSTARVRCTRFRRPRAAWTAACGGTAP